MPPPCKRRNIQESKPKAVESTDSHFDRSPHAPNVCVPLDILLLILDAVEEGWSPQIYASCARTSRAMLRPSQVRMYRTVLINQPHHFASFSRTMLGNRDLALLVKKLIADVGTGWPAFQDLPADQLPLSSNAISRLQNLQELTVIGLYPNIFHPKQAMSSPLIERFLGAFAASCSKLRCLRLKQLELQEYAGLVRHIVSFSEMETLELDCVTWTRHGRLRSPERYIRDGACTNLHTLKISFCGTHRRKAWNFITFSGWGTSIQQLVIRVPHKKLLKRELKGLSAFLRLRSFELHLSNDDIRCSPVALRHITSAAIRTVRVVHHCQMQGDVLALYAGLGLDDVLAEPQYTSLESVAWCLVSDRSDADGWFQDIPRCFPGLVKRGILVSERRRLPE
ncbi:hypothetical protein OH76DRAFT_1400493 [Lentinus brumalis]|uniref:F-box domain-containing protein n=1 Tax=Lentinus brumalis TaxID=2498619 RepID=A0A371DHZ0_9APHY|nr:hypothetical protein OH76DRAFT_1400493 [Polyporus brumalis]